MTAPTPPASTEAAIIRSYRYRLAPTAAQAARLGQISGACRFVYNLALEQRENWYRQYRRNTGYGFSYIRQSYELTALRAEVDWIAAVPRHALDEALRQLDYAYSAFFAGRARHPTFRRRDDGCGFTLRSVDAPVELINAKWGRVRLRGAGWIKLRLSRPLVGIPKMVSFREECGQWHVSVTCAAQGFASAPPAAVGIDRGIANTLALSSGGLISVPAHIGAVVAQRLRAQRKLARCKKGSKRRLKQRARVARLHARARRIRTDWAHRVSTDLAKRFGTVAVEDLKIGNMVLANRGLSRSIHSQGWGHVVSLLAYKLKATGGTLIKVNPAYTSQACSSCGAVDSQSRESQARFLCVHCGHDEHADINAAKNILRRSTALQLAEEPDYGSDETRTMEVAA
jgi:putative transposase